MICLCCMFFFSSRRRHTRYWRDWSSDVCSSDLLSFGTAGMRGIRGIGRNRMNRYNVGKATQGLANYILQRSEERRVGKSVDLGGRRIIKKKKNVMCDIQHDSFISINK